MRQVPYLGERVYAVSGVTAQVGSDTSIKIRYQLVSPLEENKEGTAFDSTVACEDELELYDKGGNDNA